MEPLAALIILLLLGTAWNVHAKQYTMATFTGLVYVLCVGALIVKSLS